MVCGRLSTSRGVESGSSASRNATVSKAACVREGWFHSATALLKSSKIWPCAERITHHW